MLYHKRFISIFLVLIITSTASFAEALISIDGGLAEWPFTLGPSLRLQWNTGSLLAEQSGGLITELALGWADAAWYGPSNQSYPFNRWDLSWGIGYRQGIAGLGPNGKSLVDIMLAYRGRQDWQFGLAVDSWTSSESLNDQRDGLMMHSLYLGIIYDSVITRLGSQIREGIFAEASLEWFPGGIDPSVDFLRFNAGCRIFLPLWEITSGSQNLCSAYLANNTVFEMNFGPEIPLISLSSIGGYVGRKSLGGDMVRGLEDYRYPSPHKFVDNLELRVLLPSFSGKDFIPGIILLNDLAIPFDNKWQSSAIWSVGAGFYIQVANTVQLGFSTHYLIYGQRLNGQKVAPLAFFFAFSF